MRGYLKILLFKKTWSFRELTTMFNYYMFFFMNASFFLFFLFMNEVYDFSNSDIETVSCTGLNDLATNLENLRGCLIFHLNIRSLNKHIDDLILLINSIKVSPDIIVCTETRKVITKNFCEIDNYTMHCANAKINQNDSVCIYI